MATFRSFTICIKKMFIIPLWQQKKHFNTKKEET